MAAATGTVVISQTGSNFDSADFPRFVLGDGTNSLTFVIDNDARGLKLTGGGDADGYSSASDLPFEDSQKTRLVVPTFDEADGAKKALLAFWITDEATFDDAFQGVSAASGSAITAIGTRAHFVLRDAGGNEMKIGGGNADATSLSNSNYTLLAKYGSSGSPRFWLYRKDSTSEYFIRIVTTGTNGWKAHMPFLAAIKHANDNSLIDITARGVKSDGTLMTLSSVANDTYTASEVHGIVMEYDTAGFAGNACYMEFKDANTNFNTAAKRKCMSWGYSEFATTNVYTINRHSLSPTDDQFWGENKDSKIWFRQGTIAGSGSDASLSTANIAEAIKDMINGSYLEITATRDGSTVNLTNDNDGDSGNVTITTTNKGSLFSVTGMSNAGGGGGGGGGTIVARTRIDRRLIAVGGIQTQNIGSGSIEIGHLNFGTATSAQKASGSLETADLIAVYDKSADAMKAVSLEHLEAFMSGSNFAGQRLILDTDGDTLIHSEVDDAMVFMAGGKPVMTISASAILPGKNNAYDLGSDSFEFKDAYIDGTAYVDAIDLAGTAISATAAEINLTDGAVANDVVGGKAVVYGTTGQLTGSAIAGNTLTVASTLTANGDVDLGNATSDTITATGRFDSDLVPSTHEARDLGSDALSWDTVFAKSGSFNSHVGTQGGVTAAGTISGSAGTFHTLTADHLDVQVINSTVRTNTTLEVADKLIVSALTASSANASGGGLKIGGSAATFGLAEMLWDHANQALDLNISGTTEIRLQDGVLRPETNNDVDLGTSGAQFKDLYIDGTAYLDAIDFNGTAISATAAELNLTDGAVANNVVGGKAAVYGTTGQLTASALTANTLTVASTVALNGPVTLGDATGDDITFTGRVASTIDAKVDSSYDLGSADRAFRAIYVDSVDLSGQGRILLDADLDTFIHSEVDDAMVFTAGGKPVMTISASAVLPGKNNAYDLGSDAFEWKDLYVDGTAYVDAIDLAGTAISATAAEINLTDGAVANTVVGSTAVIYGSAGQLTGSAIAGNTLTVASTLTANGDVDLGNATSDTITATGRFDSDLVPSSDSARKLGTSTLQWSEVHVDAGHIDALHGTGIVTIDNIGTGSINTAHLLADSVTKAKLNKDIVQNYSDANGGLKITAAGLLSVGVVKRVFVRADGANISGSLPTRGMYATDAVPTPFLTASLSAQPQSGSVNVFLNGILLHGYAGAGTLENGGGGTGGADYLLHTASNAHKIQLNTSLALDSDDILTITYLSGSTD
tara:strand:- start:539 stop:4300 length:3762 start_codon:yes stop_codon:yes gene_type:complete